MTKNEIIYEMTVELGYGEDSSIGDITDAFWERVSAIEVADYLADKLINYQPRYETTDGAFVNDGDTVYVIGSSGVKSTKVDGKHTTYMVFSNLIPVKCSWFSREKAEEAWASR